MISSLKLHRIRPWLNKHHLMINVSMAYFLLVNRYWSKGCALLSCLLGLTWIVGVFVVNEDTIFMAYLFNIFNTLQVSYCLNLNTEETNEHSSMLGWDQSWTPLVAHLPLNPSQVSLSHAFTNVMWIKEMSITVAFRWTIWKTNDDVHKSWKHLINRGQWSKKQPFLRPLLSLNSQEFVRLFEQKCLPSIPQAGVSGDCNSCRLRKYFGLLEFYHRIFFCNFLRRDYLYFSSTALVMKRWDTGIHLLILFSDILHLPR